MEEDSELRVFEIGDGGTRTITIDPGGKFPLIIGRGAKADVRIGLLGNKTFIKDQAGNDVPISKCISKIQATIYRYDDGQLRIHDGNGHASASGIRVFGSERAIERPVLLSPGAHIELIPRTKGYCCWLEWADSDSANNEPTLGFNRWNNGLLQDDNRVLEGEKEDLMDRIRSIEMTNAAQDQRIRATQQVIVRVRILGLIAIAAFLISLGIDPAKIEKGMHFLEQLEKGMHVIAILASGGLVWTATEKSKG